MRNPVRKKRYAACSHIRRERSLEDKTMSATHVRCGIEDLVVRIQADFLATPWLALRLPDAEERFGVDRMTCEAVLDTLAEAHVLERSRQGVYIRYFPQVSPRPASAQIKRAASHAA
jgi:hypothetical protein